jgi:hypothetical protein
MFQKNAEKSEKFSGYFDSPQSDLTKFKYVQE